MVDQANWNGPWRQNARPNVLLLHVDVLEKGCRGATSLDDIGCHGGLRVFHRWENPCVDVGGLMRSPTHTGKPLYLTPGDAAGKGLVPSSLQTLWHQGNFAPP